MHDLKNRGEKNLKRESTVYQEPIRMQHKVQHWPLRSDKQKDSWKEVMAENHELDKISLSCLGMLSEDIMVYRFNEIHGKICYY